MKKHNWEKISEVDALYGIASSNDKRDGQWNKEEFFEYGKIAVEKLIEASEKHHYPKHKDILLDFGCGAGRLLRHTSQMYKKAIGVDVSKGMIDLARAYNSELKNVEFILNTDPDLKMIADNSIDFVYTLHVLQHIPSDFQRRNFIREFFRVLKTQGFLVFHVPVFIPLKNRFQIRRRLFDLLNGIGFSTKFLMNKLYLYPIHMKAIPKAEILEMIENANMNLLECREHTHTNGQISATFYLTKLDENRD